MSFLEIIIFAVCGCAREETEAELSLILVNKLNCHVVRSRLHCGTSRTYSEAVQCVLTQALVLSEAVKATNSKILQLRVTPNFILSRRPTQTDSR